MISGYDAMSQADYYRSQAERCRRLIRVLDDPETEERLTTLAKDYERRAHSSAAKEKGHGGNPRHASPTAPPPNTGGRSP
jgi:hypothetical protein